METITADFAINHQAAPAPSPAEFATPTTRELRTALADAIAARRIADAKHATAADVCERTEQLRCTASTEAHRLKAEHDAAAKDAIAAHAAVVLQAMQTGAALPDPPPSPDLDDKPLMQALAFLRAVKLAAIEAQAAKAAAQNEAGAAAAACHALAEQIIVADARVLAAEWIAATRLCWELQDRLTGLARIGDGAFLPHKFQADLLDEIDRRKAAIAGDALMLERHNYDALLDRLSADQEKLWRDYGHRLMSDADATFDAGERPQ